MCPSEFIENNSTFLITTFGIISSCCAGCLMFVLKSRCTKITVGCLSCERAVLSEDRVMSRQSISQSTPPPINSLINIYATDEYTQSSRAC